MGYRKTIFTGQFFYPGKMLSKGSASILESKGFADTSADLVLFQRVVDELHDAMLSVSGAIERSARFQDPSHLRQSFLEIRNMI